MARYISKHAIRRMQQRGITKNFLTQILNHADIERPANDNCRLYRVSKREAVALGNERLSRVAIILSDDSAQIVTVVPISRGRRGAIYRKHH